MKSIRFISVFALLAILVGCSSSTSSESNSANTSSAAPVRRAAITDPCKLLTQSEASAAMGEAVGPGELTHIQNVGPRCRFIAKSQDELYIDVADPALFDAYAQTGGAPVTGIGDKALWGHSQFGSWLHIEKSGNLITVGMPAKIATMTPAVEQAGKHIAGRM